jgi:hypothetical protein
MKTPGAVFVAAGILLSRLAGFVRLRVFADSASSTNAIAPVSGHAVPHACWRRVCRGRLTPLLAAVPWLQCAAEEHARLPVQTCADRSVVVMGRDQRGEVQDVYSRCACRTP